MGFFPLDPGDGDEIGPNANGTYFKYVDVDNKWIIIVNPDVVISDLAYNATDWNTNPDGASKNVLRDKIVAMDATIATKLVNIVEDGSPQLGANLDCQSLYLYNCNSIRSANTYIYFYPTNQTTYYFRMHNDGSNITLFGRNNVYIDSDNSLYLKADATLQLYGNHASGHAINMTATAFYPTTTKSHDLGLSGNAWDDLYFDDSHNVGTRYVNPDGLWEKYLNMKLEPHPTAKTTVGDTEIDIELLIPELREEDRYEKQYDRKFVGQVARILKKEIHEVKDFCKTKYKNREDCPNDLKDMWRKLPEDMTPQEYGVSMSQWTLINCMIIKELQERNEALEKRIKKLEEK